VYKKLNKYFVSTILFTIFNLFPFVVNSQGIWNLTKCIEYAIDNNIDLNIKRNLVSKQIINFDESKAAIYPDLNLGSALNINFGRNIDGTTNDITFNQTISNNIWLSSSIDIFQGMVKRNRILFNKYLLLAEKEESESMKNRLIFNVVTAYYTTLYSIGLEEVAQNQVKLSEKQYKRMQKLVDVGKESLLKTQDLKSQWVADKLNLTKAINIKNDKLLELKQLLRLKANDKITLDTTRNSFEINTLLPEIDSLNYRAINFLPEMKQQNYLLDASKRELAVSKGKISPRLYLSAGLNTGYFNGIELDYLSQIKNNQSQQVRLGLLIPIFNNASVSSDIKRKKIAIETQELKLEKQKEQLYSDIWKAIENTKSAEKEYQSAIELYKFSKISFQSAAKRLETGIANSSEFEIAKQRLFSSEVAKLKSELTYLMYRQILEFYRTGNWNHIK